MSVTKRGAFRRAAACRSILWGIGLALALGPLAAQGDRPPDEALASLQERGRQIALYLKAVDKAADLLKTQGGGATQSDRTVVIPGREGWRVVYLEAQLRNPPATGAPRKGLAIVAETTFSPDAGEVGALGRIVPPRAATATIQSYARSLEEAEGATVSRPEGGSPFMEAVIRETDGTFTVYVISQHHEESERAAAEAAENVVFGRDFVIRIAATGRQVLTVERLHDAIASLSLRPRAPGAPLLHEHGREDLPAPTDVALVLRHPVLAPLLVLTPRFMFRIDREGAVTWLGANPNPKPAASPGTAAAQPAPPSPATTP